MVLKKISFLLFSLFTFTNLFSAQISEKANFIYFGVPKVGTNTIHSIFGSAKFKPNVQMKHLALVDYNSVKHDKYFKFGFVRNPWDRMVSCYFNKVASKSYPPFRKCFGMTFTEFVKHLEKRDLESGDCHIRLQCRFFPALEQMDFIGRIENFTEDFQYLMTILGLNTADIPRKNSTSHDHYSTYYTEETRDIIERLYQEDIETFGYTFE